ncbi:tetratricopeptide repeat protein [Stieleria bergensis]|uniref:tetratricopeptide repeat protein n=1 Tax=Stieleria bergensis TaxID=2528025 RepID=UPI003AF3487E
MTELTDMKETATRMRVHCLGIASGLLGPLFAVLMLGGCGDRAAQEEAAALLKRQQQRLIQKDAAAPKSREEQLVDTRRFLEQDNPELAIQSLKSLLVASPNDPEVLFVLAQTQHAAGALDLAVQAIEQMPKPAEPEGDGRWQRRAFEAGNDWLTEAGRLSAAERLLTKAIEQFQAGSHSVRFRRRLAENLALQGRRFEASKQLRWLAKRDAITERELFQMQFLRGTVVVDVQKDTGAKGQLNLSLLRQAKQAHAESRSREANAMIRPLSDAFPESASVAAFQMRLAHEMGDDQAWLAQLDQMPPGVAQQPEYWWTLADWYSQSGRDQMFLGNGAVRSNRSCRLLWAGGSSQSFGGRPSRGNCQAARAMVDRGIGAVFTVWPAARHRRSADATGIAIGVPRSSLGVGKMEAISDS